MKKSLWIILVILVVAIGVIAGYFYLTKDDNKEDQKEETTVATEYAKRLFSTIFWYQSIYRW